MNKCYCNVAHAGPCDPRVAPRRSEEILGEYQRVCAEAGDLEYRQKVAIPARLQELYERAKALNLEHAAVVAAQSKESNSNG